MGSYRTTSSAWNGLSRPNRQPALSRCTGPGKRSRSRVDLFLSRNGCSVADPFADPHIEFVWLDLHANVTRNHPWKTVPELKTNVYNSYATATVGSSGFEATAFTLRL